MDKLIIRAAITGSRITRETTPYIPFTPEEIIQSAVACRKARASVVHIHVRDPDTGRGTQNLKLFRQVVDALREKTDLILIYYSKGVLAETNSQFVERIVKIARENGRDIATPADARKILKL